MSLVKMSLVGTTPLGGRISSGIAGLFPGYFALVMATGIVSIATNLLGLKWIATPLLWVNVIAYASLSVLFVARLLMYPRRVLDDLRDRARGAGFFTLVAGTCVFRHAGARRRT